MPLNKETKPNIYWCTFAIKISDSNIDVFSSIIANTLSIYKEVKNNKAKDLKQI